MRIVIIGAGPAGLAAAEAASAVGASVLVVDDNVAPGGQIWRGGPHQWSDKRAHELWQILKGRERCHFVFGARVVSRTGERELLLDTATGPTRVLWDGLILCGGARELLLPFPGWTLPGVLGAGGMQALIKGGAPMQGRRVVVAGTGPLLLAAAATAKAAGANVAAIVEAQPRGAMLRFAGQLVLRHRPKLWQAAKLMRELAGIPMLHGALVTEAIGDKRVQAARLRHHGQEREIPCDLLACGYGLVPNLELAGMLEVDTSKGRIVVDGQQQTSRAGIWAAGEGTGIGGVDKALIEGRIAGRAAAGLLASPNERGIRARALSFATLLARSFPPPAAMREVCRPSTIVCRCEDVTAGALALHRDWRSAKLQTRAGMGPCQGRICGAACQHLFGWDAPGARPPIVPTNAATLALAASEEGFA